jgi:threonine dehydratase
VNAAPPRLPTLADVRDAARLLEGRVIRTPFLPAPKLSALTGADVSVKYENLQVTNAFKERGAYVKLTALAVEERARGVIAMSAGNHAQAVAYHARGLRVPATIVMPVTTPFVKVAATRGYGARVVLAGETVAEAQVEAQRIAAAEGLVWVHPYDDFDVIRGQGTIALEMLADDPGLDTLVVPVGGGGLIAGMATAAKAIKPDIRVVGVEAALYPSLWAALRGEVAVCGGNTLAEGIAVKTIGRLPLAVARTLVDDVVLVDEVHLERAVNAFLTLQKTMAEGAGAAGLAALIASPERFAGRRVGLVLAGGNIDPRILAGIMIRELARAEQIVAVRVTTPDRPGVLGEITTEIGALGGNILQVSHHRTFLSVPAKGTSVDISFETRDGAHAAEIVAALETRGLKVARLPADEVLP